MALDNEQDDELEPESPEGTSGEATDSTENGDAEKPSNRFSGLGSRLSKRMSETGGDDDDSDNDDDSDDDDDESEADGEGTSETDGKAKTASQDDAKPGKSVEKGGKAEQDDDDEGESEDDESPPRFEIVDSEGSKYDLDLPEGATIKFAGDGKTVEAKSIDDLVQMAQKGVAFDRVTSRQGKVISDLKATAETLTTDQKADQELIRQLVTGEVDAETLEALEKHYAKLADDPEALEKEQALQEKKAREKAAKEQGAKGNSEGVAEFWNATSEAVTEEIGSGKFEFLEPDDKQAILQRFNQTYLDRRAELVSAYVKIAPEHDVTEADAVRQADADAIKEVLNRKTLRRVIKEVDDNYRKRAEKGNGKRQAEEIKDAEGHNRQIEARRLSNQNPANRSLRAGGAAVNTREVTSPKNQPKGFEGKIDKSLNRFAKLRKKATTADDDGED